MAGFFEKIKNFFCGICKAKKPAQPKAGEEPKIQEEEPEEQK